MASRGSDARDPIAEDDYNEIVVLRWGMIVRHLHRIRRLQRFFGILGVFL